MFCTSWTISLLAISFQQHSDRGMVLDGGGDSFFATVSAPCQRPMRLNADIQARLHWPSSAVSLGDWPLSPCNGDKPCESPHHERISAILLEGRCEGDMEPLNWGILLQTAREGGHTHDSLSTVAGWWTSMSAEL